MQVWYLSSPSLPWIPSPACLSSTSAHFNLVSSLKIIPSATRISHVLFLVPAGCSVTWSSPGHADVATSKCPLRNHSALCSSPCCSTRRAAAKWLKCKNKSLDWGCCASEGEKKAGLKVESLRIRASEEFQWHLCCWALFATFQLGRSCYRFQLFPLFHFFTEAWLCVKMNNIVVLYPAQKERLKGHGKLSCGDQVISSVNTTR